MTYEAIAAVTLLQEDLEAARSFYAGVLGSAPVFQDAESVVFRLGAGTMINLLIADAAPELVDPAPVGDAATGVRAVLTLQVADVDAERGRLAELGVTLLNGPLDRPWGPRTASFRDPGGHVWELASSV